MITDDPHNQRNVNDGGTVIITTVINLCKIPDAKQATCKTQDVMVSRCQYIIFSVKNMKTTQCEGTTK